VVSFILQNCLPPLCVLKATIYKQNVAWTSKLIPQLLFFFVNFDFFLFFWIFLINIASNEENR
jgi:hypothetical protein